MFQVFLVGQSVCLIFCCFFAVCCFAFFFDYLTSTTLVLLYTSLSTLMKKLCDIIQQLSVTALCDSKGDFVTLGCVNLDQCFNSVVTLLLSIFLTLVLL